MSDVTLSHFAAAHADGAHVVDVREPHEYVDGHVPGARLVPMDQVAAHAPRLSRTRPVYVICANGNRSRTVADHLRTHGVDARSVLGGTTEWVASGRPVVTGPRLNVA